MYTAPCAYTAPSAFAMNGAMASSFCAPVALSDTVPVSVFIFLRDVVEVVGLLPICRRISPKSQAA
ncbi:MAG: hypothetical protein IJZ13_06465 [Clostridia bacterium]|nr:hypothetical protein [Clostridia bacterium]